MADIKRRGFLGLMAGAVASGPKLAAGIADNVAVSNLGAAGGISFPIDAPSQGDWKAKRIAQLKNIILGIKDDAGERERQTQRLYQLETVERFRLDGLRSVSPTAKAKMFIAGSELRQERISRLYAQGELERLLSGEDD